MTSKNEPSAEPLIARDATYYRAPEALRKRIHDALAAEAREQSRSTWWQWGGIAAAIAMVGVISWNAAMVYSQGSTEERLAGEVMTAHIRSVMSESHLNDVVSTDQHTVKPWFIGKLDFAPNVTDLAASGFTLTGGRLDYVNGRTVAALTYRHRLHVVNLFEWPAAAAERDLAPEALGRKGYSIIHWRRAGIEYWAISDVAGADLLALADVLSKG
ncbi:MAG: anti-sigma factor family protein [Bacillota bacterium]